MKLTEEQFQAVQSQQQGLPLKVQYEPTGSVYYLISQDQYERLQALLDNGDVRSMEPLLADLQAEDWEDASNYQS